MNSEPKILVTGGSGMVGNAIKELYPSGIYLSREDGDLRDAHATVEIFKKYRPHYVIHLAATVGGVKGNMDRSCEFYEENVRINTNVIEACRLFNAKRVVSMLSTCVYPDEPYVTYPLTENQMHMGPPHDSNFGYAHAKRMLEVHGRAAAKTCETEFICAIPNNIYGAHDNFHLEDGHVIPALIRKIWEAKHARTDVTLWGDGSPLREFTHASDIARAVLFLLWTAKTTDTMVNVGCTHEYSIQEVAGKIGKYLDFSGNIIWDTDEPSGQHRKPSCNVRLANLGFDVNTFTSLDTGLKLTCDWFKNHYPYVRGVETTNG